MAYQISLYHDATPITFPVTCSYEHCLGKTIRRPNPRNAEETFPIDTRSYSFSKVQRNRQRAPSPPTTVAEISNEDVLTDEQISQLPSAKEKGEAYQRMAAYENAVKERERQLVEMQRVRTQYVLEMGEANVKNLALANYATYQPLRDPLLFHISHEGEILCGACLDYFRFLHSIGLKNDFEGAWYKHLGVILLLNTIKNPEFRPPNAPLRGQLTTLTSEQLNYVAYWSRPDSTEYDNLLQCMLTPQIDGQMQHRTPTYQAGAGTGTLSFAQFIGERCTNLFYETRLKEIVLQLRSPAFTQLIPKYLPLLQGLFVQAQENYAAAQRQIVATSEHAAQVKAQADAHIGNLQARAMQLQLQANSTPDGIKMIVAQMLSLCPMPDRIPERASPDADLQIGPTSVFGQRLTAALASLQTAAPTHPGAAAVAAGSTSAFSSYPASFAGPDAIGFSTPLRETTRPPSRTGRISPPFGTPAAIPTPTALAAFRPEIAAQLQAQPNLSWQQVALANGIPQASINATEDYMNAYNSAATEAEQRALVDQFREIHKEIRFWDRNFLHACFKCLGMLQKPPTPPVTAPAAIVAPTPRRATRNTARQYGVGENDEQAQGLLDENFAPAGMRAVTPQPAPITAAPALQAALPVGAIGIPMPPPSNVRMRRHYLWKYDQVGCCLQMRSCMIFLAILVIVLVYALLAYVFEKAPQLPVRFG